MWLSLSRSIPSLELGGLNDSPIEAICFSSLALMVCGRARGEGSSSTALRSPFTPAKARTPPLLGPTVDTVILSSFSGVRTGRRADAGRCEKMAGDHGPPDDRQ